MASKTLGSELTEQLISPTNLSQVSSSHDNGDLDRSRTKKYTYLPSQEVDTSKVKDKLFERRKSNPSVRTKPSTPTNGARSAQVVKFRLHRDRKMESGEESEEKYETLRQLGRGAFGSVNLAKNKKENSLYAIKSMAYSDKNTQETASREITCLLMFSHPFIVKLVDIFKGNDAKVINVVLTYCDGGDLAKLIKQEKKNYAAGLEHNTKLYNQQNCLRWFSMSCLALDYLHSNGIIHRDIKPDNILLSASSKNCRLADFGLAKVLDNKEDMAVTEVGTTYYISPEIVASKPYSYPTDIWSLGCVMYELFTLKLPFYGDSTVDFVHQLMYMDVKMDPPEGGAACGGNSGAEAYQPPVLNVPDEIWKIIGRMLEKDQEKRITIKEILASRIMKKVTASVIQRHKPEGMNTRQKREEGMGLQAQYNDILAGYEEEFGEAMVEEHSNMSLVSAISKGSDESKGDRSGETDGEGESEASSGRKTIPPLALPPMKPDADSMDHDNSVASTPENFSCDDATPKNELNMMSVVSDESGGSKDSGKRSAHPAATLPPVKGSTPRENTVDESDGIGGDVAAVAAISAVAPPPAGVASPPADATATASAAAAADTPPATPKATERLLQALEFGKEGAE